MGRMVEKRVACMSHFVCAEALRVGSRGVSCRE